MAPQKKEKSVAEILGIIAAYEHLNVTKVFPKLKLALKQKASEAEATEFMYLFRQKLNDLRFGLYLKIVPSYTERLMQQPKNRDLLLYRLYAPIKKDVKEILDELDANIVLSLDLLREKEASVSEWLSPTEKNGYATVKSERFVFRATLCYIYLALKMNKQTIARFEQILLSIIEKSPEISYNKTTGKLFPEILLSNSVLGQIEKLAYLHHEDTESVRKLEIELSQLQEKCARLTAESTKYSAEIGQLRKQLNCQKSLSEEKDVEIVNLNAQLKSAEERLEYEIHKYKNENRTFQIAYADKLKRRLSVEIEGINTTLKHVEEPDRCTIQRRISNIEEILCNKEG